MYCTEHSGCTAGSGCGGVQVTGSAEVWELYADYHCSSTDVGDHEKVCM